MRQRFLKIGNIFLIVLVCLTAAELTARLDDWIHNDTPILNNPDREYDLTVKSAGGRIRGRPFGHFQQCRLNEYGFRSPPMTREPQKGVVRVAVLGSSEMFGSCVVDDKEVPARLAKLLVADKLPVEVINTSIVGMPVRDIIAYWKTWVVQFRPQIVVIYPAPLFYLHESGAESMPPQGDLPIDPGNDWTSIGPEPPLSSRFLFRLKSVYHWPEFIQRYRRQWEIERRSQGKPADWLYRSVPRANLDNFIADLRELARVVKASGADVVIVAPAIMPGSQLTEADTAELEQARTHFPNATAEVIVAFELQAAKAIVEMCARDNLPVVDAATAMSGKREMFEDLVHFNDAGAEFLAKLLAEKVRPLVQAVSVRNGSD